MALSTAASWDSMRAICSLLLSCSWYTCQTRSVMRLRICSFFQNRGDGPEDMLFNELLADVLFVALVVALAL